jgi:hypothetical protein
MEKSAVKNLEPASNFMSFCSAFLRSSLTAINILGDSRPKHHRDKIQSSAIKSKCVHAKVELSIESSIFAALVLVSEWGALDESSSQRERKCGYFPDNILCSIVIRLYRNNRKNFC